MAYSESLAKRIRHSLTKRNVSFEEKKMMGGLTFMVNGKMCVGINKKMLMVRIDPDNYQRTLTKKGAREMDFTGRPMKGFLFIEPNGTSSDSNFEYWIDEALAFNPKIRSSKKK